MNILQLLLSILVPYLWLRFSIDISLINISGLFLAYFFFFSNKISTWYSALDLINSNRRSHNSLVYIALGNYQRVHLLTSEGLRSIVAL